MLASAGSHTICTSVTLDLGNSSGKHTFAVTFVAMGQAISPTPWDDLALRIAPLRGLPIDLPAAGTSVLTAIPCDGALSGTIGYLQTVAFDPAATNGVALASRLKLIVGDC